MSQHVLYSLKVDGSHDLLKEQQESWNSILTNWSQDAKHFWDHPRITMIRIEVLVSAVAVVLFLLAIFGSQRRRSKNWFLQNGLFGAYTLSYSLATYIIGSMQSSTVMSSTFPVWAVSLFFLHACTDSITAYSLVDNRQIATQGNQVYMYFAYVLLLWASMPTAYNFPFVIVVIIAFVRYAQKLAAYGLAIYSWNWNKMVADYMYDQQNLAVFATLKDCNYLVDWSTRKSKFSDPTYATQITTDEIVIDIGKIWRCEDKSVGPELKYACLSFSLFHLLRSRCFGFACDEHKARARNFVLEVLLSKGTDGGIDCNRVFKVIDIELAFMYDFFFTKYAAIYYGSRAATIWSLVSAISVSVMAYITDCFPVEIYFDSRVVVRPAGDQVVVANVLITLVILASIALLELVQLLFYWMGIWGRVSFVCQYLREQTRLDRRIAPQEKETRARVSCCIMGLKEFLAKIGVWLSSNKHYWQHKLGQYSLLDSVSNKPSVSVCAQYLFGTRLFDGLARILYPLDSTFVHQPNYQASRARQKAFQSVNLSDEVKDAVIRSLKLTCGKLSNGISSLETNEAQHLSWACTWEMHPDPCWSQRKQNQTHIILTWHIATCYCEMIELPLKEAEKVEVAFSVATILSKYCAYLVVSAPKLLPGHHYDTRQKFDAAAAEAAEVLKGSPNNYMALKGLTVPEDTTKIFESGVKLGKQLELMKGPGWKVMADFWAEMMLYLAPSDNVTEHIEHLAQGGEFITHLWALLFHAGILEREQEHPAGGV